MKKQRTVAVQAGLYADEAAALEKLANECALSRGSVRLYAGSVLREHLLAQQYRDNHAASKTEVVPLTRKEAPCPSKVNMPPSQS